MREADYENKEGIRTSYRNRWEQPYPTTKASTAPRKHIVSVIRDLCNDVEMTILFGSYARGDYKEETDLKPDRKSGHKSDYDILVVSKEKSTAINTGLWQKITRKCNNSALSTHVQIIAHNIIFFIFPSTSTIASMRRSFWGYHFDVLSPVSLMTSSRKILLTIYSLT